MKIDRTTTISMANIAGKLNNKLNLLIIKLIIIGYRYLSPESSESGRKYYEELPPKKHYKNEKDKQDEGNVILFFFSSQYM